MSILKTHFVQCARRSEAKIRCHYQLCTPERQRAQLNHIFFTPPLPSIMSSHYNEKPFRLLDLPRELRDEIYEYALDFHRYRTEL